MSVPFWLSSSVLSHKVKNKIVILPKIALSISTWNKFYID